MFGRLGRELSPIGRARIGPRSAVHQRVSCYSGEMAGHADLERRRWRNGEIVDIAQAMMRLTLGIVGRTLFDTDLLAGADTIAADVATLQRGFSWRARVPFRLPYSPRQLAAPIVGGEGGLYWKPIRAGARSPGRPIRPGGQEARPRDRPRRET